mmetsp:Transcript_117469/g.328860  ORF Transcript_117469/g.328860 Transcript_117469/m.328860 type:complete len:385 (+) Transcript_117469:134-1288(+)
MPDGPQETPYGEPLRVPPEKEPLKMLPVLFILVTISCLYSVYTAYHLLPLLQIGEHASAVDLDQRSRGIWQGTAFNLITLLLLSSYIRCILVHPGDVPNESPWLYSPVPGFSKPSLLEAKKTGERRHCKWCGKYKPDRCHHCRICQTCILKMDHHCPWIYNCVGFHNYKFFLLLLFYTMLDTHFIMWTMTESMVQSVQNNAPFWDMFSLLFGLTLAFFFGTLVTLFFAFHFWLTANGLTTIEFCEKRFPKKKSKDEEGPGCLGGFESSSPFNLGTTTNLCSVLGWNPLLWLLPITGSPGDGLTYDTVDMPKSLEGGRGAKKGKRLPKQNEYDALQSYGVQGYGTLLFQPAERGALLQPSSLGVLFQPADLGAPILATKAKGVRW